MEEKKKTTRIEAITLNIGRKTVMLTVEEAKELKAILSELFGADKVVYETNHVHHHDTSRTYPHPYWYGTAVGNVLSLSANASEAPTLSGENVSDWMAEVKSKLSL